MTRRKNVDKSSALVTKSTQDNDEKMQATAVDSHAEEGNKEIANGSRRSGRRCVSNSRYKDMIIQMTPRQHRTQAKQHPTQAKQHPTQAKQHPTQAKQLGTGGGTPRNSTAKSDKSSPVASEKIEVETSIEIDQLISGKRKRKTELCLKSKRLKYNKTKTGQIQKTESTTRELRCTDTNSITARASISASNKVPKCAIEQISVIPDESMIASVESVESPKPEHIQDCVMSAQIENFNPTTMASGNGNKTLVKEVKKQSFDIQGVEIIERVHDCEVLVTKTTDTTSETTKYLSADEWHQNETAESSSASAKFEVVADIDNTPKVCSDAADKYDGKCDETLISNGINAMKDSGESCSQNQVSADMDLGRKYLDSSEGCEKATSQEASTTDLRDAAGCISSDEQPKDDGKGEKVKVMEEEMMSLLNLFLADSSQKKNIKPENNVNISDVGGTVSEHVTDMCQVTVVSGTGVNNLVTSRYDSLWGTSSGEGYSKATDGKRIQNIQTIEPQVHLLPAGSKVFLVEGEARVISNTGTSPDGVNLESVLSPVNAECGIDMPASGRSDGGMKQLHFVVKASKNKVEINSENVQSSADCGDKVDGRVKQSDNSCRQRIDSLLRISDDGTFCCTKCEYKTEKKVNWYKHKLKHQERRYQCPKCDYKASTSSNLKRHILSHDDVRVFGCKLCWATFPQKVHLLRHIKSKHQPHSVQCSYCDYVCAEVQPDLISHMKCKHPELCPLDKDGKKLGDHNGMLDAFLRYKCDKCNVYTFSRKDLQQHMKVHKKGPELKFFCEMCSFVTACESRLKRHMLTHTKEKPYGCNMCNYRGSLREHVKRHLKTKHNVDVSFGRQKKIRRYTTHKLKQEGGVLMEGRLHDKKSYSWSDTRNSEKHFACNFCSMRFTKLISLFKHVHVQHSQLMPPDNSYSCVVCDYTTNQYKRLLLHMRKVHSTTNCMNTPQKQVYVCMSCSYSTPYRLFLHAHLKKEHNMQIVTDKYMMDASKHSSAMIQTSDESEKKPGSIIKNTVAGKMGDSANPGQSKDSKMVLLQLTPDGPMTPVVINMGDRDTDASNPSSSLLNGTDNEYPIMETGITDAECSLDMQCEVIFDDELGRVLGDTGVTQDPVAASTQAETLAEMPGKDLTQDIEEISSDATNALQDELSSTTKTSDKKAAEESTGSTEESVQTDDTKDSSQVLHLSSGDFLEINGQIYKIEMEDNSS